MADGDGDGGATTRERLLYVVPRALGFAVLVALPVTAALAWLSITFDLGPVAQFGLLFLLVVVFRVALRPRFAPVFTHPKDRDRAGASADGSAGEGDAPADGGESG